MGIITEIKTDLLHDKRVSIKDFKKKPLVVIFPSYRHHPVAFITCDTYIHTHTIKRKKLGVLGTQLMMDKLFFSSHLTA